jgi:hypothetical protein
MKMNKGIAMSVCSFDFPINSSKVQYPSGNPFIWATSMEIAETSLASR